MLDYDSEARTYDATRGGEPRAEAAADALERLLPPTAATVLDLACGTGIVTRRLLRPGRTVLGLDRSPGMLAAAAPRLPDRVVRADATRLPLASARVDAVVSVWLLHLVPDPEAVVAEAARVLRPGGVLITTVDKDDAHFAEDSDLARLTADRRRRHAPRVTDHVARVLSAAAEHGLRPAGGTTFPGIGQGRSPRSWHRAATAGRVPWCTPDDALLQRLADLPDQDTPRPEPRYRLVALRRP